MQSKTSSLKPDTSASRRVRERHTADHVTRTSPVQRSTIDTTMWQTIRHSNYHHVQVFSTPTDSTANILSNRSASKPEARGKVYQDSVAMNLMMGFETETHCKKKISLTL